jgi:hypothetical protein
MAAHVLAGTNHPTGPHKFSVVVDACAAPGNKASPELFFFSRSVLNCFFGLVQYYIAVNESSPEFAFCPRSFCPWATRQVTLRQ